MSTILYLSAFLFLTFCILSHSALSLAFAFSGLQLWFQNMIPALLPFMILSGTLIRMELTEGFTTIVYPLINPVFRVSRNVCYVMIVGFMCGFPMGAKCVSDLYQRGDLSRDEASFLLAFCNNIGPVYFVSFALPTIGCDKLLIPVLGMYGLPLLYGLFLRYTRFRTLSRTFSPKHPLNISQTSLSRSSSPDVIRHPSAMPLLPALDEAIHSALQSMLMLGGYMIFFNLLMIVPKLYFPTIYPYLAPSLEITGGLSILGANLPLYSLFALPFGGFSCIAQTYTCIRATDLSLREYVLHKLTLTALTICYYLLLRLFRLL